MAAPQHRLAVRFDEAVWLEAVRGFSRQPFEIAATARSAAERRGVALADVRPCEGPRSRRDKARGLRRALYATRRRAALDVAAIQRCLR